MAPPVATRAVNLVLLAWDDHQGTQSRLARIAAGVMQFDPSIRAFVVANHRRHQLALLRRWFEPTLSVSLFCATRKLLPGRFLTGTFLPKHLESARLDAAGIPVPQWCVITPGASFDPTTWGPYVVEKPSVGVRGAHVRVRKTARVRYVAPDARPPDHLSREGPMLIQRFVYTGPWPTSYRAVTLFGEVLLCYRQTSKGHGQPLRGRWAFRDTGGINIASNTRDMVIELANDDDVIALAERAHRQVFPHCPLLGLDIVRDAETGDLSVLECHTQGTWPFGSESGISLEASNNVDFESQFDAMGKAACILARETRRRAMVAAPWNTAGNHDGGVRVVGDKPGGIS